MNYNELKLILKIQGIKSAKTHGANLNRLHIRQVI